MFALINSYEELCDNKHIYSFLDKLKLNTNSFLISTDELVKNKGNIKNFILNNYSNLPKYLITFYGIGTLEPIIKELHDIGIKVILISVDIHHASRLAKPRISVYNMSYLNFNTYGYQLNKWNLPNCNNNYFFPHSAKFIVDFNNNPKNKILVSGALTDIYPDRQFVANLKNNNIEVLVKNSNNNLWGENFYKYLGNYLCCFLDTPRDYVLAKTFEICASGSLLLSMNSNIIDIYEQMGFIDGENYISCTRDNINEKINFILNPENKTLIDKIRFKGYELVKTKHHYLYRYEIFMKILDGTFQSKQYINNKYGTTYYLAF